MNGIDILLLKLLRRYPFQDFVGRLSSEKQPDEDVESSTAEETGMISGVSELELSVTITTEGSRFLGKTATCSRFG